MDDKVIFEKMKEFFNASSIEEVAEKMGYSRSTAGTWRSKGLTQNVKLKFASMQVDNKVKKHHNELSIRYFEDVTASAGYGSQNDNENFMLVPVSSEFMENVLKLPAQNYDLIKIYGDSMEPFANNGDIVVIDRLTEIKNGDMVIANINGDVYMKKFLRNPVKNEIKLTSLNEFYQDITINSNEIDLLKIVGKVKCKFNINMKIY